MKYLLSQSFLLFFAVFTYAVENTPRVTISVNEQNGRLSVEAKPKEGLLFGKILSTEKKTGMICLVNNASFAVKLGGWRSPCECLDLDEPTWELARGAKSESKAILNGSGYRGEFDKNMHISFSSEDSETVNFFLPVKFVIVEDPNEISSPVISDKFQEPALDNNRTILPEQLEIKAEEFDPNDTKTVFIFAGRTCPGCNYMKRELGPKLLKKYGVNGGRVALLDLEKPENMLALAGLEEKLGTRGTKTPVLYFRGMILYGKVAVEEEIGRSDRVNALVSKKIILETNGNDTALKSVKKKAEAVTIGVIAVAGLIDGINPCVFAGLVFLASLLASSRMGGRKLLLAGTAYCFGSFVCYFLMGLGFLGILNSLVGGGGLPKTLLNGGMSMALCAFSFLSFRDAIIFKRNGSGAAMSMKLPDSFRERIRRLMKKGTSGNILWPGAFGAGILVTVIESACTGQIYAPVLAFLVKMEGALSVWLGYLLLYNLMFVAPLVGLLIAVYLGMSSLRLVSLTRIDAFTGKILMGAFFAFLAILMIFL